MDKLTVVHLYNGNYSASKRDKLVTQIIWVNLKVVLLSKSSHSQNMNAVLFHSL